MRYAFILNPAAKSGRAGRQLGQLRAAAKLLGLDATFLLTEFAGHETDLARAAASEFDRVIAVGGDGTVQGVANGLLGSEAVIGVLPLGTGNDFAQALGMPRSLGAALEALVSAPEKSVDLGRVRWRDVGTDPVEVSGARIFTNCLGVGFDAAAALGAAETKWIGGRGAYVAAVLKALWLWRHPQASVAVRVSDVPGRGDDPKVGDLGAESPCLYDGPLFLCEIGNGFSVGGGFLLTPDARLDDGLLDVCIAEHLSTTRALRILPTAFSGAHVRFPEIRMGRGVRASIVASEGVLPVQADGEAVSDCAVAVEVEVLPRALRALAPQINPRAVAAHESDSPLSFIRS